jgi:hypothetical protein
MGLRSFQALEGFCLERCVLGVPDSALNLSFSIGFLVAARQSDTAIVSHIRPGSHPVGRSFRRPPSRAPSGRTQIPEAFRWAPAVSRRAPVSCSMRLSCDPSRLRAITCCVFAPLKTLLIPTKATALRRRQHPRASFSSAGFEVTLIGRFWLTPEGTRVDGGLDRNPFDQTTGMALLVFQSS